jgi:lipopolysaccharide transport protein LptA
MKYIFILFLLFSYQLQALEATVPNGKNKVKIKAVRGTFDQKNNIIKLREDVFVDDNKMTINCQFMDITLEEKKKSKEGSASSSKKAKFILAEKKVVIKDEKMTATGERAEYYVALKKLVLTGNPKIVILDPDTGERSNYSGNKIIYCTDTKVIEFVEMNGVHDSKKGK